MQFKAVQKLKSARNDASKLSKTQATIPTVEEETLPDIRTPRK